LPAFSTVRTYMQAINTGDTNITRVLTILMHYPAQWAPNVAQITVNPQLSQFLKDEFGAPGRMTQQEIDHIDTQWPMAQKEILRTAVLQAIDVGRPMIFKWGTTPGSTPETVVAGPAPNAPLTVPVRVTFLSPAASFVFSGEDVGNAEDVTLA
jgi:hypothetical protein